MATAVRRTKGQDSRGPSGVADQSRPAIRSPHAPPPARKAAGPRAPNGPRAPPPSTMQPPEPADGRTAARSALHLAPLVRRETLEAQMSPRPRPGAWTITVPPVERRSAAMAEHVTSRFQSGGATQRCGCVRRTRQVAGDGPAPAALGSSRNGKVRVAKDGATALARHCLSRWRSVIASYASSAMWRSDRGSADSRVWPCGCPARRPASGQRRPPEVGRAACEADAGRSPPRPYPRAGTDAPSTCSFRRTRSDRRTATKVSGLCSLPT